MDKLVAWLVQPGHKPPADPDPSETQTPAPAPAPSSTANQTSGKGNKRGKRKVAAGSDGGHSRWKANHQMVRMLHAIVENKDIFLRRHKRPVNRDELEAGSLKSRWVLIALDPHEECRYAYRL